MLHYFNTTHTTNIFIKLNLTASFPCSIELFVSICLLEGSITETLYLFSTLREEVVQAGSSEEVIEREEWLTRSDRNKITVRSLFVISTLIFTDYI